MIITLFYYPDWTMIFCSNDLGKYAQNTLFSTITSSCKSDKVLNIFVKERTYDMSEKLLSGSDGVHRTLYEETKGTLSQSQSHIQSYRLLTTLLPVIVRAEYCGVKLHLSIWICCSRAYKTVNVSIIRLFWLWKKNRHPLKNRPYLRFFIGSQGNTASMASRWRHVTSACIWHWRRRL